jgi:AraC-like DNA-binding protein
LHPRHHRLPPAVPHGHILAARAVDGVVCFGFQEPPAIVGCGPLGQQIELPVDRTDHPLFLHQAHGRWRQGIAHADQIGDWIKPVAFLQPVPIGKARFILPQHQSFIGIVHIMGKEFKRSAACISVSGDRRKVWPRHIFKINMALAPRHKNKGAAQANFIAFRNLGLYKSAVAAPAQDRRRNLYLTRQRPRKRNLSGQQWRQIIGHKARCMIGQSRAQTTIAGTPLMPGQRDRRRVARFIWAHLRKYVIELHGNLLNAQCLGRQAIAFQPNALSLEDRMPIRYWAEGLVPQIGGLERDTVAANFVDRILRGAVNMGASRPRLLSATNLTDSPLRNPIGRLARPVLVNLFAAIEREFKDLSAPMKMATIARPGCFSDLGFVALFSATVGQTLADTVKIQLFRQNIWKTSFNDEAHTAQLSWTLPDNAGHQLDSCIEFSVASYVHLYTNALPSKMAPNRVNFHHRPRFDIAVYEGLLGCPVSFGMPLTSIIFDHTQLNLPSPDYNPGLQQKVLAAYNQPMVWLSDGKPHAAFSFLYLASELNKSPLKLDRLAASFGLSERTLRRKLVAEGYPFRDLLEKVRQDMCDLYLVENRRSISTIAELLGYAELSAFTRAYKRWYGHPPSLRTLTQAENSG